MCLRPSIGQPCFWFSVYSQYNFGWFWPHVALCFALSMSCCVLLRTCTNFWARHQHLTLAISCVCRIAYISIRYGVHIPYQTIQHLNHYLENINCWVMNRVLHLCLFVVAAFILSLQLDDVHVLWPCHLPLWFRVPNLILTFIIECVSRWCVYSIQRWEKAETYSVCDRTSTRFCSGGNLLWKKITHIGHGCNAVFTIL